MAPDLGPFSDVRPLICELLEKQRAEPQSQARRLLVIAGLVGLALLAALQARATARHHQEAKLVAAYERVLGATPGYAITSVDRYDGGYRIRGLRDPRALPAPMVVTAAGLPLATFELAPFDSSDPRFETPMARVNAELQALEQIKLSFALGESLPVDTGQAARAAELIRRAQVSATQAGASLCVDVIGDSDESGGERANERLRAARAAQVARALEGAGVAPGVLVPRADDPMRAGPHGRTVTFRAALRPASAGRGCS